MRSGPEWDQGEWGEREVRAYLERSGQYVVPASLIDNGGAPMAISLVRANLVLPDVLTIGGGGSAWWEVKTKTVARKYQKTGAWRHGVDKRCWLDYLTVEEESGLPGWLAIVQRRPPRLLAAPFERLRRRVHAMEGSRAAYRGAELVYWDVDDFDLLGGGAVWTEPPPPPIVPKVTHPWDPGNGGPEWHQPRLDI